MIRSTLYEENIIDIIDTMVEESELLPLIRSTEQIAMTIAQRIVDTEQKGLEISMKCDDYAYCLEGCADIDGFSGYGEAWFNEEDINNFIDALSCQRFPVELAGGYYGDNGKLKDINFGLTISEIGSNGTFSLVIVFQDFPGGTDTRKESIRKFASELIIGRRQLKHIIESLSEMLKRGGGSFII